MSALSVWFARDWGASWGMGNSLSKLGSQGAVGCPKCPMSGGFRSKLHAEGSQVPREYRFRGRSLAGNPRPQSRDGFFNDSHQYAFWYQDWRESLRGFPQERKQKGRPVLLSLKKTLWGLPILTFTILKVAPDPVVHICVFLSPLVRIRTQPLSTAILAAALRHKRAQ